MFQKTELHPQQAVSIVSIKALYKIGVILYRRRSAYESIITRTTGAAAVLAGAGAAAGVTAWGVAPPPSASERGRDAASELDEAPEYSAEPLSVASTSTKSSSPAHVVSDDSAENKYKCQTSWI